MKKAIVLIMFLLSLFSVFAAQEEIGPYRQNTCVNILQSCGNCTYSNITLLSYPNGSAALQNTQMEKLGTQYNHTFCNTTALGDYIVSGISDVDGVVTTWAYPFKVNGSGADNSNMLTGMIFIISLVCLSVILTIWFWKNDSSLRYFFFILTFILVTVLTFFGYEFSKDYGNAISNVSFGLYRSFLIITAFVILIVLLEVTIKVWQTFGQKNKKHFEDNL